MTTIHEVIGSNVKAQFSILSSDDQAALYSKGFVFNSTNGDQEVDMSDFDNYLQYRNPLNVLIHETAEQFESKKLGTNDYDVVHAIANERELEITGRRESSLRTDQAYWAQKGTPKGSMIPILGVTKRFDYIDKKGNYIETRQATFGAGMRGRLTAPSIITKNLPSEKVKEQRFTSAETMNGIKTQ